MEVIILSKSYKEDEIFGNIEQDIEKSLHDNKDMDLVPDDRGQYIVTIIWNDK